MVTERPKRYRDELQAHYTESSPISYYMAARLNPKVDDTIWEPCGGEGDLVDSIIRIRPESKVYVSELNDSAVEKLRVKYKKHPNIIIEHENSIDVGLDPLFQPRIEVNKIIANPPYGAWQSKTRRKELKRQYPRLYVRETYALFIYNSFQRLRKNGRMVFIVPDTFLWLNRHEYLRRKLFTHGTFESIVMFPSKFFPKISFGYSGMCIFSLRKTRPTATITIKLFDDLESSEEMIVLLDGSKRAKCTYSEVRQLEIVSDENCTFQRAQNSNMHFPSKSSAVEPLGNLAEVKTGFYSGNDIRWIRRRDSQVKRSKKYADVDYSLVEKDPAKIPGVLNGISGKRRYIPIMRGGASLLRKETQWYVDWSINAVSEYRRKGKNPARFQNSKFYFRQGIGVPMVASSNLTAAMIENRVFDQGIVGIFPHDESIMLFLLGYLNTSIATKLLRQINGTANNSCNYLKRLPIPVPSKRDKEAADAIVQNILADMKNGEDDSEEYMEKLDKFYKEIIKVA